MNFPRSQRDREPIFCLSSLPKMHEHAQIAQLGVRSRILRFEFQRAVDGVSGFRRTSGALQHMPKIAVETGNIRLLLDCRTYRLLRLDQATRGKQYMAELRSPMSIQRLDSTGSFSSRNGLFMSPLQNKNMAELTQCVCTIWHQDQSLPIC